MGDEQLCKNVEYIDDADAPNLEVEQATQECQDQANPQEEPILISPPMPEEVPRILGAPECKNIGKNFRCGPRHGYCESGLYCSKFKWCDTSDLHKKRKNNRYWKWTCDEQLGKKVVYID